MNLSNPIKLFIFGLLLIFLHQHILESYQDNTNVSTIDITTSKDNITLPINNTIINPNNEDVLYNNTQMKLQLTNNSNKPNKSLIFDTNDDIAPNPVYFKPYDNMGDNASYPNGIIKSIGQFETINQPYNRIFYNENENNYNTTDTDDIRRNYIALIEKIQKSKNYNEYPSY